MNKFLVVGFAAAVFVSGCAPSAAAVGTAIAQTQAMVPTSTVAPAPSATAQPTVAPSPTKTAQPPTSTASASPAPSDTAAPTETPLPTATDLPPTATAAPLVFSGQGDSVIDLPHRCECVAHITGNKGHRFFAVETLDDNNKNVALLVNTADPYDGYRPLDFVSTEKSARIKVTATGAWSIELVDLFSYTRSVIVPGHMEGTGDDIVWLMGARPDLVMISGNERGRFFAVESWSTTARDLLVNTADPYSGTVPIAGNATLLQVTANDAWSIDITGK
jgi:hypothetical protein